jgi:plastocyanin domain-containing protein
MKSTIISVIVAVSLVGLAYFTTRGGSVSDANNTPANNVSIVDGKQIIEIKAKGGYTPRKSVAKAGMPTVIRFNTSGTFDCSASVRIPSMNINKILPQSGITDLDVGIQQVATLQGMCGMGMYPFEIEFKS